MPFTFSHPAIVLPLTRLRFRFISASALIAGSMAPDFEYFIRMKLSGRFSHTWQGAFIFDLPVALLVLIIFHGLVKQPLINSLPAPLYCRLVSLRDYNWLAAAAKHPVACVICILTGIFSHILWDSFTHANHYFTEQGFLLSRVVQIPGLPGWPLFRYLQHVSTAVGGLYVLYYFYRLPVSEEHHAADYRFLTSVLIIAALVYSVRACFGFEYLGDRVASMISAIFLSLIIASLICRFTRIKRPS